MSTDAVPRLFAGLVDDAAAFPPGLRPLAEVVAAHHGHRDAWYAPMVGRLVVAATMVGGSLPEALRPDDRSPELALIGDSGLDRLAPLARRLVWSGLRLRQVEASVAKRGEDPLPGLARLVAAAAGLPGIEVYAEIPLTFGLMGALDVVARMGAGGTRVTPKFRTGGLAAELFPSPADLARVIVACHERGLVFKLTGGLQRAIRNNDPETGFVHHGFLNILAGSLAAANGATHDTVRHLLTATDPVPLIEAVRADRARDRPLWTAFGSSALRQPVEDLTGLGLLT